VKKIISLVLVLVLALSLVGAIYATSEITTDCNTVELTKIEGLKNTLGVQNLDIRIGGFSGYNHIQNCCFEDTYFGGSEMLNVSDINNLKISIRISEKTSYWKTKIFNLENGNNECIWEYAKYPWQKIKIRFIFMVSDCPETTDPVTTETSEPTAATTPTPASTETAEKTTDLTATPEITNSPETTEIGGTLPNTGEKDLNFLIVIGIVILLTGIYFAVRFRFLLERRKYNS